MTQTERLRKHLDAGRAITPLQALREFGCLRLAARIADLRREGYPVSSAIIRANGKRFASYWKKRT